jgi:hypothetical protein
MSLLTRSLCIALLLGLAGCRAEHHDDHEHEHEHEHEHGHAEHTDPPHWPDDFPDAVARLLDGQARLRELLSAGQLDATLDGLLHVQRDLAKWLPEVAADSDMPEPPWNRVNALAAHLLASYEGVIVDFDAGRPLDGGRLAEADSTLKELELLDAEADTSWFPRRPTRTADAEPADEPGLALGERHDEN